MLVAIKHYEQHIVTSYPCWKSKSALKEDIIDNMNQLLVLHMLTFAPEAVIPEESMCLWAAGWAFRAFTL